MLRVIDSGKRPPRENLSLTEAICQSHRAGRAPATLRFQHFPPSAIIGRHQRLDDVVDLAWCKANHIATARRMTGGGAIIMGLGLLGWELILQRGGDDLGAMTRRICEAVAAGLSTLGLAAEFRPRNDIEVGGRKICGTGGYFDGSTLVFQGTVILKLDGAFLINALKLPAHKLEKRAITSMQERVTDLHSLLGYNVRHEDVEAAMAASLGIAFGLEAKSGTLSGDENRHAQEIFRDTIGQDTFVAGSHDLFASPGRLLRARHVTSGGIVEVALKLRDGAGNHIAAALFATDMLLTPARTLADLEAALAGVSLLAAPQIASDYLHTHPVEILGGTMQDLIAALVLAIETPP